MVLPALLLEIGSHQAEVAETLISVGEFLVIFVAARVLAELMVRLQLPTILGELVAGVLIGVSGLHLIVPPETQVQLSSWGLGLLGSLADLSPETVQEIYTETFPNLQAVSQIGLFALLFLTGLESELDELVAVGAQATTVAVTGVVLPFALGTAGLYYLFHVPLIPAIFAGAAMTATSIGITASVFGELKFLRTREGQTVIGAAVLDDILGIVILAVVVSLAGGEGFSFGPIIKLVAAAGVFVAAALFLSRTAAPGFDWLLDQLKAPGEVVVAAFVVLSLCCFVAQAIGLEAALGAFAAGLILSASKHTHAIQDTVKPPGCFVCHDLFCTDWHGHGSVGAQPNESRKPGGAGRGGLPAHRGDCRQGGRRLELREQGKNQQAGSGPGDDAPWRSGPDFPGSRYPGWVADQAA